MTSMTSISKEFVNRNMFNTSDKTIVESSPPSQPDKSDKSDKSITHPHSPSWKTPWRYLGFTKSYNVPLFIIFAGAMLGFSLAKLPAFNFTYYQTQAAPGEMYWNTRGHYEIGLRTHIISAALCGLLMIWQFIPTIRQRAILFHRINGYLVILLVFILNITALMIARRAFGGTMATQSAVGVLAIITTIGICLAYYNIKKLQIEQHRAWMLRTMYYLGTIITTRLIMIIAAQVVTMVGSYWMTMSCGEVLFVNGDVAGSICEGVSGSDLDKTFMSVKADFGTSEAGVAASFRLTFGMALWMAIFLHVVGVEIYLALTPREAQRLRMVSYEKQLAAGYKIPGSAGLVVEKFGDAEAWQKL